MRSDKAAGIALLSDEAASVGLPAVDASKGLRAFILTTAQASDRWERMEQRLKDANATYTKFAGIDGRQRIPMLTKVRQSAAGRSGNS